MSYAAKAYRSKGGGREMEGTRKTVARRKAAIKQGESDACINYPARKQVRPYGQGSNFLIKREQSETRFDFAKREESQRS